jgi:hypothetical protein
MNKILTAREDYEIAKITMQQYQDSVKIDTELFEIRQVFSSVFKTGVALISIAELAWPHYFMGSPHEPWTVRREYRITETNL